jgi:hypothetical protein
MKKILIFIAVLVALVVLTYPWWSLALAKQALNVGDPQQAEILTITPIEKAFTPVQAKGTKITYEGVSMVLPSNAVRDAKRAGTYQLSEDSMIIIGPYVNIDLGEGMAVEGESDLIEMLSTTPQDLKATFNFKKAQNVFTNLQIKKLLLSSDVSGIDYITTLPWNAVVVKREAMTDVDLFTKNGNYSIRLVGTEAQNALPMLLASFE